MNNIGVEPNNARGMIGFISDKMNNIGSSHDTIAGIKVAQATYESAITFQENYRQAKLELAKTKLSKKLVPERASTKGFFNGPTLKEINDIGEI